LPTRFTGPVLNRDNSRGDREWFSNLPITSEPDYAVYFNDFLVAQDYAASDWVVTTTEAGAGSATEALAADERSGALLLTNDDADNDLDSLQSTEEFASLTSGKKLWMEFKVKLSDATESDFFMGLGITDTTPLDTSDRVGFQKDDGNASILCKTEKDSTETSNDSGVDFADDTYVTLGFYYDGGSSVEFYVNRAKVATHTTNVPDDENLAITMHIQNGEAAAKTLTVDYIYLCQQR
jgi:hypothetical protein